MKKISFTVLVFLGLIYLWLYRDHQGKSKPDAQHARFEKAQLSEKINKNIMPTEKDQKAIISKSNQQLEDPPVINPQHFDDYLLRFQALEACFSQKCNYPTDSPRSYELGIYKDIEKTLNILKNEQKIHPSKNKKMLGLMSRLLRYEKAEVKILALEILATLPKDERVVPIILKQVIQTAQPEPVGVGLNELSRYNQSPQKAKIDQALIEVLTHGSLHSAKKIAKGISPFITSDNRPQFLSALEELSKQPLSKEVYLSLRNNL